ncbi:MAG: hypothetical protein O3C63_04790 [Cyanobacteria bacterium]|nr:hypothetical protein [Cyanobacteriota bacterium]MDA1020971.1 hypothetical protein [Cyanobacteriota bacterium]
MKLLLIGSGSKEHAMIWKLLASDKFADIEIVAAPGNQALAKLADCVDVDINDIDRLLEIAIARNISLTIVGDSRLFTMGIVDLFRANNRLIMGPTQLAAEIESSNAFARDFLYRNQIPGPRFVCFDNQAVAEAFLERASYPLRICVDKEFETTKPARVACDIVEANKVIKSMFKNRFLSRTSSKVIFEEVLEGPKLSINTVCDGTRALSLLPVQAYREENELDSYQDMGAYAPTPVLTPDLMMQIRNKIIDPTLAAMTKEGRTYSGLLAFDIVLDSRDNNKPKLLQYRTCFADSDAQVILPLLDEDLFELFMASANLDLSFYKEGLHKFLGCALSVNVVTADSVAGYRQNLGALDSINNQLGEITETCAGLPLVFYGLTGSKEAHEKESEIFGATAVADNLLDAQILAYKLAGKITLPSKYFEPNIGDAGMIN